MTTWKIDIFRAFIISLLQCLDVVCVVLVVVSSDGAERRRSVKLLIFSFLLGVKTDIMKLQVNTNFEILSHVRPFINKSPSLTTLLLNKTFSNSTSGTMCTVYNSI